MAAPITKSAVNYQVAWISALHIERLSAEAMLDEKHEEPTDFNRNAKDQNSYDWGSIHGHDIVLTSLPVAGCGKVSAATCVTELLSSLPHIKFGLLVGIGAGLPNAQNDIQLGDVVVGQPDQSHGGVIQYDLGKAISDGTWELKGFLSPPPRVLLNALSQLKTKHEGGLFRHVDFLDKAMKRHPFWGARYAYPEDKENGFSRCKRRREGDGMKIYTADGELIRPPETPHIHYGTIASGDTLVKDEITRDIIPGKIKQTCLCIEMEAAGLLNKFPCIVIRGISDFADSHKNDHWQRYASATAAAFAKELLYYTPINKVKHSRSAIDSLDSQATFKLLKDQFSKEEQRLEREKVDNFLKDLYTCSYAERKDRNIDALDGTCQWFVKHTRFVNFVQDPAAKLLWVSADPGCGKSVLSKFLVDKVLNINKDKIICYFFFKDDFLDQNRSAQAMSAMLRQLIHADPAALKQTILNKHNSDGKKFVESFQDLWEAFLATATNSASKSIVCVFDALDECQTEDRRILIKAISKWHQGHATSNLKILATSRPYYEIKDDFHDLITSYPNIHLSGENEDEAGEIAEEIDIVLRHRTRLLCKKRSLTAKEEKILMDKFVSIPQRTYLWAHLTMNLVENTPGLTTGHIENVLADLPLSVEQAYESILNKSPDHSRTRLILHILMAAQRPLTVQEVSIAFSLTREQKNVNGLAEIIEPEARFERTVRELCGLFVFVKDLRIYFLHQTAREFLATKAEATGLIYYKNSQASKGLSWRTAFEPSESHRLLAERCLWYLSLVGCASQCESFFEYCNHYWPLHFREGKFAMNSPLNALAIKVTQYWSSNYWRLPERLRLDHHLMDNIPQHLQCSIPTIFFPSWFGQSFILEALLQSDPRVTRTKDVMSAALSLACMAGNSDVVVALLGYGAAIYPHGPHAYFNVPPLYAAVQSDNLALCRLLLDWDSSGLDLDYPGFETPLSCAAGPGDSRILPKPYGFHGISPRNVDIIQSLIARGADRGLRSFGSLPIEEFLEHRYHECTDNEKSRTILASLLPPGTNWNEESDRGKPSLMRLAALGGCFVCLESISEMGGSIDVKDLNGNNLLHHAAAQFRQGGIIFALSQGINIESRNEYGLTALSVAASYSRLSQCEILLGLGADVKTYDGEGRTALACLIRGPSKSCFITGLSQEHCEFMRQLEDFSSTVALLIANGVEVNAKDAKGSACIHYAASMPDYELLTQLLEAGAEVDVRDNHGRTALIIAAQRIQEDEEEETETTKLLLKHSADPRIADNDGRTALWYIEERLRELQPMRWRIDSLDPVKMSTMLIVGESGEIVLDFSIEESVKISMEHIVLLRYGLNAELDSLIGDPEFFSYLKGTIGESFTWPSPLPTFLQRT